MTYGLALGSILLVGKRESSILDARDATGVIQRCFSCGVVDAVDGEGDVLEEERLAASFFRSFEVLSRAQEPAEGDDDEVKGVLVEHAFFWVVKVEGFRCGSQDGDVGWVGSGLGVVFLAQCLEEVRQSGMELG